MNPILPSRACLISGKVKTEPIAAEDGVAKESLSFIENGDSSTYKYLDFVTGMKKVCFEAATPTDGWAD